MSETESLKILGRVRRSEGVLVLDNVLSGFEAAFCGTTLTAVLEAGSAGKFLVDADGETREMQAVPGPCTLFHGAAGRHRVRVVKMAGTNFGKLYFRADVRTDGEFLPPSEASCRILFLGDSITAGCGAAGTCAEPLQTLENTDATRAFAYLAAQALGADLTVLALERVCVSDTAPCARDFLTRYSPADETPYLPQPDEADLIVLALGENDMWHATSPDFPAYSVDRFRRDYAELLIKLKTYYPNADMVCMYGMMPASSTEEADAAVAQAIAESGQAHIVRLRLAPDTRGGNFHPCAEAHRGFAAALVARIREIQTDKGDIL